MPFTPFHFGPGILLKACAPRAVSLTAFVISQVVIDIESGYHLLRNDWPVHREVHSLPVAGLVGILTGTAVWIVGRKRRASNEAMIQAEVALLPAHVSGLVGGLSHPLLDAVMHTDLRPFWPFSTANPLLAVMGLGYLHLFCVGSGIVGAVILMIRFRLSKSR